MDTCITHILCNVHFKHLLNNVSNLLIMMHSQFLVCMHDLLRDEYKYNKLVQYRAVRMGEIQGTLYEIIILKFTCFHATLFCTIHLRRRS